MFQISNKIRNQLQIWPLHRYSGYDSSNISASQPPNFSRILISKEVFEKSRKFNLVTVVHPFQERRFFPVPLPTGNYWSGEAVQSKGKSF
jgi:hypothetical protein